MTEGSRSRARRALALVQTVVGVLLFALVAAVAVREWDEISRTLRDISAVHLAAALLLTLVGLFISALTWRLALALLGSNIIVRVAAKAYLIGQLGKYLPGSVWAFVVQMEISARAGVPRPRSVAAGMLAILVNLSIAVGVAALCVPGVLGWPAWFGPLAGVMAVGLAFLLAPRVLCWAHGLGMRRLRGRAPASPLPVSGIRRCMFISLFSWIAYGLACWVLVIEAGGAPLKSLPVATGGVAAAMAIGFLAVVAPSGIGVREAVLVFVLSSVLDEGAALTIALVLRLLVTLADVTAAGLVLPVKIEGVERGVVASPSRSAREPAG